MVFAIPGLALFLFPPLVGDLTVGYGGVYSVDSLSAETQSAFDAGMNALATIDPATKAAVDTDMASGNLQIGELCSSSDMAASDYNTIAIRFDDHPTPGVVAARIVHEMHHRENDYGGPHSFDPYPCQEARAMAATYNTLCVASCMNGELGMG